MTKQHDNSSEDTTEQVAPNSAENMQDIDANEEALNTDEIDAIGGEGDLDEGITTADAELLAALQASETQLQEQKDAVLRAKAEVENMRRRSEQEIDKARKYALNKFAEELLPVIDNLERAMAAADSEHELIKPLFDGVEMTHQSMISTVAKFGLKEINPEGEAFDPERHQAMGMQESTEHEPNMVMMVLQKGYELNGRVIRPAMVMVSK